MMTLGVKTHPDGKKMKNVSLTLLLIGSLSACSSGSRLGNRYGQDTAIIPSNPGARLAAILSTSSGCQGAGAFPGSNAFSNQRTAFGTQNQNGFQISGRPTGSIRGQIGRLDIITLFENDGPFIGQIGSGINTQFPGQITSGTIPRLINSSIPIAGITDQSQMTYTSDGSVVLASQTALIGPTGGGVILSVPALDKGGFSISQQLEVGSHPKEITSAFNERLNQEVAAAATDNGVALIVMDRYNLNNGTLVPRVRVRATRLGVGSISALAFSPKAEWLLVGKDATGLGRAPGQILICHVGTLLEEEETIGQSIDSAGIAPGCFRTDRYNMPEIRDSRNYRLQDSGIQRVNGTVVKFAVNENVAVALSNTGGPYILNINLSDMDLDPQRFIESGQMNQLGWARSNQGTSHNYKDVGIQPNSDYPIVLQNNQVVTYLRDNVAQIGEVYNPLVATNPIALAVDPGPGPRFALVADKGSGKVLVGTLGPKSIDFNGFTDVISLPPNQDGSPACPVDVAIRTANQARRPFAKDAAPPAATADAGSTQ